jgi:hypothetical protein
MRPDEFFTLAQQQRLAELIARWREGRDQHNDLTSDEQSELDALIAEELEAARRRATALLGKIQQ